MIILKRIVIILETSGKVPLEFGFNINNWLIRISQIVNVKSKFYDSPTCLTDKNDQLITDPSEISNSFNNYFSTIPDSR